MTVDAVPTRSPQENEPDRSDDSFRSPAPIAPSEAERPERTKAWRYYICVLLLLATTINYIDRQALAVMKVRITGPSELNLTNQQYGELELGFAIAFATGALAFGSIADKVNVFWLYPAALALWSAMGYCTGLVQTFTGMFLCRTLLGVFEAGHWPCALRTTQRLLSPAERTLGNSILQSGSSVGAALAPLLIGGLLTEEHGSWRFVFQAIGIIGLVWIALWFTALKPRELARPTAAQGNDSVAAGGIVEASAVPADDDVPFLRVVCSLRFLTLLIVVASINACWHFFRAWLPMFLEEVRGYSAADTRYIITSFYVATDVGCILAGFLTVVLTRRGASIDRAKIVTFTLCALLASTSIAVPWLPHGWALVAALLIVGFGSLGLFPCYYSFSQELSTKHQGKITGLLGAFAWVSVAPLHPLFGSYVDRHAGESTRFDPAFVFAGLGPLVAVVALWLLWRPPHRASTT